MSTPSRADRHHTFFRSFAFLLVAVLALSAVGCAGSKLTYIANEADFQARVLDSDMPVMVEFYKAGCATCIALEPGLDQLADEYRGRALLAKFKFLEWYFGVSSPKIKARYDLWWAPTVILFVDGQEVGRWIGHYNMDDYRNALDAFVPPLPADASSCVGGAQGER